jgi:hypothetical protein
MAVTATPIYPQAIVSVGAELLPATGANTLVALISPGANGTKVESITLTSTDASVAYTVQFWVTISSVNYLIGSVTLPVNSGNTAAAPPVNALTRANFPSLAIDANTNPYLYLASGSVLSFSSTVVVTTAKIVTGFVQAGNY